MKYIATVLSYYAYTKLTAIRVYALPVCNAVQALTTKLVFNDGTLLWEGLRLQLEQAQLSDRVPEEP